MRFPIVTSIVMLFVFQSRISVRFNASPVRAYIHILDAIIPADKGQHRILVGTGMGQL